MNTKANFRKIYRILFVLVAWYALVGHFIQIVVNRAPESTFVGATIDYFSYFTIQSNWLVAVWWTLAILTAKNIVQRWFLSPRVKGALTAYITVTFVVYAVLLADLWVPTGFDYSSITHNVTPLAFILDWLLFEKHGEYQWRFILNWLPYLVVYFIYALIYGAIINKALYPFFDYVVLGWDGMVIQVAFILAFFIAMSALYIGTDRLLGRWLPSPREA